MQTERFLPLPLPFIVKQLPGPKIHLYKKCRWVQKNTRSCFVSGLLYSVCLAVMEADMSNALLVPREYTKSHKSSDCPLPVGGCLRLGSSRGRWSGVGGEVQANHMQGITQPLLLESLFFFFFFLESLEKLFKASRVTKPTLSPISHPHHLKFIGVTLPDILNECTCETLCDKRCPSGDLHALRATHELFRKVTSPA